MPHSLLRLEEVRDFLFTAFESLRQSEQEINELNVFPVPDGDTGTNMLLTLSSVVSAIQSQEVKTLPDLAASVTKAALLGARGNSGVILSQILKGFFAPVKEDGLNEVTTEGLIRCLESARQTAYRAVKKPVEGTMLTVIRFAADAALKLKKKKNLKLIEVVEAAYNSALVALQKTPEMLDVLKQAGVVDAGGLGLLRIIEALYETVQGEKKAVRALAVEKGSSTFKTIPSEKLTYAFCTEFLLKTEALDVEAANEYLNRHGDSVLVILEDEVAKVHVHTDRPLDILNHFKNFGEFIDIKVNNMKVQAEEANKKRTEKAKQLEEKSFAIVSVAQGEGIIEFFKSLGVDEIVEGGQTMNPSSAQILAAIERAPSDTVIVLPNNKNIVLACEQASQLTEKKVIVIPTKTIQQGIQAMISFNPVVDLEENIKNMKEAIKDVVSVAFTRAVKDSRVDGLEVKKGDYLGIVDGKIVESGRDFVLTLVRTLKKAGIEEASFVTVFLGKDLEPSEADAVKSIIENNFGDVEYEVKYGGQDHYPILASIER